MPAGVGYGPGSLGALSAAARSAEGTPQPGATPEEMAGPGQMPFAELLMALQSGQISAEALIQFLAALTGMGGGQVPGVTGPRGPEGASPIEAAMMGG